MRLTALILAIVLCCACGEAVGPSPDASGPAADGGVDLGLVPTDLGVVAEDGDVGFASDLSVAADAGAADADAGAMGDDAEAGVPDAACHEACQTLASFRDSMVLIPAGTFMMGTPRDQPGGLGLEFESHEVTLTRSFYINPTEVTGGQYRALFGINPSHFDCGDDCPVETTSWLEAIDFANALSVLHGFEECYEFIAPEWKLTSLDCNGYRLPTEAEWEYAARAGTTTAFYNGELTNLEIDQTVGCPIIDPLSDLTAWNCGNSDLETHPVGLKLPNAWGLFDMYGNVWEWVNDWEGVYPRDPVTDPLGAENARDRKIRRGGSYRNVPRYSRSAIRVPDLYTGHHYCIGFRLVRSAAP